MFWLLFGLRVVFHCWTTVSEKLRWLPAPCALVLSVTLVVKVAGWRDHSFWASLSHHKCFTPPPTQSEKWKLTQCTPTHSCEGCVCRVCFHPTSLQDSAGQQGGSRRYAEDNICPVGFLLFSSYVWACFHALIVIWLHQLSFVCVVQEWYVMFNVIIICECSLFVLPLVYKPHELESESERVGEELQLCEHCLLVVCWLSVVGSWLYVLICVQNRIFIPCKQRENCRPLSSLLQCYAKQWVFCSGSTCGFGFELPVCHSLTGQL